MPEESDFDRDDSPSWTKSSHKINQMAVKLGNNESAVLDPNKTEYYCESLGIETS